MNVRGMPEEIIYKHLSIINGPNLNLLGVRQPEIYGKQSLEEIKKSCYEAVKNSNWKIDFHQSNSESEIIDMIHKSIKDNHTAIIINAGAYSHTSIAISDALRIFPNIIIEVHLSNIYSREKFRRHSWISQCADCVLCGLGVQGYILAINYLLNKH